MAKTIVGIDIGASRLKLAVCSDGIPRRLTSEDMPDNLMREGRVVSPEAMAGFLKKCASKMGVRNCAIILPAPVVFTRTMSLPVMTRDHLELNLPYEFRDYITQEKDKYFYDYAMLDTIADEEGKPQEFELIAAATLKETIKTYSDICRRAGLKLKAAIPEELGYMNVIRRFEQNSGGGSEKREYCLIDLGHSATRLHIYKGVKHQASRVVDYGMQMLDAAIGEMMNVDERIARVHKHANTNDVLMSDVCANIYSLISVEVMRAINFYRFNSPDSNLTEVYICGGGVNVEPLVARLAADIGMPILRASDLLPNAHGGVDSALCPAAIGSAMQ